MKKLKKLYGVLLFALLVSASGCGGGNDAEQGVSETDKLLNSAFLFNEHPVIAVEPEVSQESFHVEYPTVYSTGSGYGMLYSAIGNDYRWRLKRAVSTDGLTWFRVGNVFVEEQLPFKKRYAFPYVVQSGNDTYNVYFAVEPDGASTYTELWQSESEDGSNWMLPKHLFSDQMILDPVVLDGGAQILYTSKNESNRDVVKRRIFIDGRWSEPEVIYAPSSGLYTLGNFRINEVDIVVVHDGANWHITCFNSTGKLVQLDEKAFLESLLSGDRWDAYRYGPAFFARGDGGYSLYYNGIAGYGQELYGEIGYAFIGKDWLNARINTAECVSRL